MKRYHEKRTGICRNPLSNRGSITAGTLVCLAIASAVFVTILFGAAAQRRDAARWQRTLQARWLAESAIERAAGRLANDPDYDGETWKVAAESLGGRHAAVVRIKMVRGNAGSSQTMLVAEAQYPDSGRRQVRFTKSVPMPVRKLGVSNAE